LRDADGLALSSRNVRLTVKERARAIALYEALKTTDAAIRAGVVNAAEATRRGRARIPPDETLRLEYLEIVDPDEMQPVETVDGPVLIAGALWVGSTRLIDNIRSKGPDRP
jgi:pantoate--beta-alanine ligase